MLIVLICVSSAKENFNHRKAHERNLLNLLHSSAKLLHETFILLYATGLIA